MDNETMVNEDLDLELPEDISEVVEADEEDSSYVEEVEEEEQPAPPRKEPGYVKGRIEDAVAKAIKANNAEWEARFEQKIAEAMAPILEKQLDDEANKLVSSGEFKTLERAKEYLQLKRGVTPKEPPRNEQGQFAPKPSDAKIERLAAEADTVKAMTGIDVVAEFEKRPEIRKKIFSGELTFVDLAKQMQGRKRPPAPMRSPNGASGQRSSILDMSDAAFDRMEKRISEGERFALKE